MGKLTACLLLCALLFMPITRVLADESGSDPVPDETPSEALTPDTQDSPTSEAVELSDSIFEKSETDEQVATNIESSEQVSPDVEVEVNHEEDITSTSETDGQMAVQGTVVTDQLKPRVKGTSTKVQQGSDSLDQNLAGTTTDVQQTSTPVASSTHSSATPLVDPVGSGVVGSSTITELDTMTTTPGAATTDSSLEIPAVDSATSSATSSVATTASSSDLNQSTDKIGEVLGTEVTLDEKIPNDPKKVANAEPSKAIHVEYNNDNLFAFSKEECVSVGDGSFYCATQTKSEVVPSDDGVFAAVDKEGDREIYIMKDGNKTAITDNQTDDDAPFYDPISNTIVWQRLVDGRYQIMSYDLVSQTESQLTSGRYNNMQPSRYDSATVWQSWSDNDWEINIKDGSTVTQLTDNSVHDILPKINEGYVIWQSFQNNAWVVKIHNLSTGVTNSINNDDGGSIENPRFVLVYDSKLENGDIETKGYDLESGEIVPLSSLPAPVPEQVPDPEQTGEKPAFVQQPVQIKTKSEGSNSDDSNSSPESEADSASSTNDIYVAPFDDSDEFLSNNESTSTPETASSTDHILDIEITATVNSTTSQSASPIEDLIISPTEAIDTPADSQQSVATTT